MDSAPALHVVDVRGAGIAARLHRADTGEKTYELWCLRTEDVQTEFFDARKSCGWLPPDELKRAAKFRFRKDQDLFLTTRLLVRSVLSEYAPLGPEQWRFTQNAFGRPELTPDIAARSGLAGLQFSLSRSGQLAVCAISRAGQVGIDVEDLQSKRDVTEIAASILSAQEHLDWERLPGGERNAGLLRYWVLKEAYVKARGIGLNLDVRKVSFPGPETGGIRLSLSEDIGDDPLRWAFANFILFDRYIVAIAYAPM